MDVTDNIINRIEIHSQHVRILFPSIQKTNRAYIVNKII